MPVEIKELVIRAVVTDNQDNADSDNPPPAVSTPDEQTAIIDECVRQVLKILNKTKQR